MRGFWKRGGDGDLAARLKRRGERARPEFVNELAREVRSTGGRRLVPSRLLLAAVLTFVMLVALASVGGSAGAGIRAQLTSVVKSVNKKVTAERGVAQSRNDDDDDRGGGGGGGGRGDDDDDDGGGRGDDDDDDDGGRGDDDDDDDGDDDQYEEDEQECELALQQAHASFHQRSFTQRNHRTYHQSLARALDDCDEDDDDDDDD